MTSSRTKSQLDEITVELIPEDMCTQFATEACLRAFVFSSPTFLTVCVCCCALISSLSLCLQLLLPLCVRGWGKWVEQQEAFAKKRERLARKAAGLETKEDEAAEKAAEEEEKKVLLPLSFSAAFCVGVVSIALLFCAFCFFQAQVEEEEEEKKAGEGEEEEEEGEEAAPAEEEELTEEQRKKKEAKKEAQRKREEEAKKKKEAQLFPPNDLSEDIRNLALFEIAQWVPFVNKSLRLTAPVDVCAPPAPAAAPAAAASAKPGLLSGLASAFNSMGLN